ADVLRHRPVRLVPEDVVGAALECRVGPLRAEGSVRGLIEATRRDTAAVVEDLAGLRVHRHPAALRLAAERPADAPRAYLHFESDVMRGRDDVAHRAAVIDEVVLGERVQDGRESACGDVFEVPANVTENADAEVRDAGAAHSAATRAACADAGRSRRCESSATSRYRSPR